MAQKMTAADFDDSLEQGIGTNAMLADTINRWKYMPKRHSQVVHDEETIVSDDEGSDVASSKDSVASGPDLNGAKSKSNRSAETLKNGTSAAFEDSGEESEANTSSVSEYKPTSESSDGEWMGTDKMESLGERKKTKIAREEKELRTFLKKKPTIKPVFNATNIRSSLELLRQLREKRRRDRERRLGLLSDVSSDDEPSEADKAEPGEPSPQPSVSKAGGDVDGQDFVSNMLRSRQIIVSDDDDNCTSIDNEQASTKTSCVQEFELSTFSERKSKRRKVIVACDDSDEEAQQILRSSRQPGVSQPCAVKKPADKLSKCVVNAKCLAFFETATEDELQAIPRCNERMSKLIVEARPFCGFSKMIHEFENRKGLSTTVIEAYAETVRVRHALDCLLYDCEKLSADLEPDVARLKQSGECLIQKPSILSESLTLKPYQLVGLNWLVLLNKHGVGAVLADEMGLGKTVQVISFLAYLKERGINQPNLIIVPSSTLDNWLRELNRWCPSLSVFTYYGSVEDRWFLRKDFECGRNEPFDVVLTTYKLVTASSGDRAFHKRLDINYAIFDEAHMLKSCNTARYKSLMNIRARHRILLTGTPLQNNLVELVSLVHFVMPEMFVKYIPLMGRLLATFEMKKQTQLEKSKIERAKQIMRPFVLRRLKVEVMDQLPEKHEHFELCELTESQSLLYRELVSACDRMMSNNDKSTQGSGSLCSTFMQLRKVSNHPLLLRSRYDDKKVKKIADVLFKQIKNGKKSYEGVFENLLAKNDFELHSICLEYKKLNRMKLPQSAILNSGKIAALERLLPLFKSQGNKVLIFSQFTMVLDVLEAYLNYRKYTYVRMDGSTPVVERQGLIDVFNTSDDVFLFLLSTRAGGLGINLTSANVIILHDIDFNPHNDRQAEDRCHRIGQTKDVHVIKLICRNTIDESMLSCARRKLLLERKVTDAVDEQDEQDVEYILREAIGK